MLNRLIFIVTLSLAWSGAATQFWIATDGNDANPGTRAKPFATLERARDAIRELKQKGSLPKSGVTVWVRSGDYFRTNALVLAAADSGAPQSPIIWRGYKDEPVRLLGGRMLTGFTPVSDPTVLARLNETARGNVVQINLRNLGIADF